jgi:hypothetical protein
LLRLCLHVLYTLLKVALLTLTRNIWCPNANYRLRWLILHYYRLMLYWLRLGLHKCLASLDGIRIRNKILGLLKLSRLNLNLGDLLHLLVSWRVLLDELVRRWLYWLCILRILRWRFEHFHLSYRFLIRSQLGIELRITWSGLLIKSQHFGHDMD